MPKQIIKQGEEKMIKTIESLQKEFHTFNVPLLKTFPVKFTLYDTFYHITMQKANLFCLIMQGFCQKNLLKRIF